MIKSKSDLAFYISEDMKRFDGGTNYKDWLAHTEKYYICRYLKMLRKTEYWLNNQETIVGKIVANIQKVRLYRLMHTTQLYIHPNVFGPGLYIPHLGRILTPPHAKFGKNCTVRPGLLVISNLGMSNKKLRSLQVGDNVEFSEGCKILCTKIGNNVIVGPNSVVVRNVPDNTTVFPLLPEYLPRDI